MQSQLKKLEGSINPEHGRNLQLLKERYNNLLNDMKKANEIIESKRSGMMTNITNEITSMSGQIKTLEGNLMK